MNFSELGLNRFGYKDKTNYPAVDALVISDNTNYSDNFDAGNVQTGTVLRNVIIEAQVVTVIPGFTNTQMTSIPLPNDGIRIDFNGIYGRKAGVTTFSLDAAGNATFSGTIIGALIQTSASGDRIEINSNNEILFYQAGDIRTYLANGVLGFNGPFGVGAGAIYGSGTNQIILTVGGDGEYEWTETEFYPIWDSLINLGRDTSKWNIIYANEIGDAANKVVLNGSVVACPLPTVLDALEIIRKIPPPSFVGDRGHFGDRLYFDDQTFPDEVLIDVKGKREIEHTNMIGLLMKAVVELTSKVDKLEKEIALIKN